MRRLRIRTKDKERTRGVRIGEGVAGGMVEGVAGGVLVVNLLIQ